MASWRVFDSSLIDVVRGKPVLYNTRLKEFRNNKIKENAWKAVATELGSNGCFFCFARCIGAKHGR